MKKKQINFSKKLFLGKETVANLSDNQQAAVKGGATLEKGCTAGPYTAQCPSAVFICYDTAHTACLQTNQYSYCVCTILGVTGC
ncbi:class I lanthipeptide [Taibaiella koreensis]|uniref:class I lanthipeptide n=1 Tax=Taibaiella koreensis TaxID=1268548 RepID=UPI000E59CC89|nr:class I lanthipeptide [Taibaiella koreensis]